MAVTYKLIETVTVGSGGAASIEFGSIPQTYTDLLVVSSVRITQTSPDSFNVYFNGTNTNLSARYLLGTGSSSASGTLAYGYAGTANVDSFTANVFSNSSLYIPNYTGSTTKSYSVDNVAENNATLAYTNIIAGLWSGTSAITTLTLVPNSTVFMQYSSASLYGIKNS
jgi:hypothetical protein